MPLTMRTQQWSTFSTGAQSQSESEQAALMWNQGVWHQQQIDGELNWMKIDEVSPQDHEIMDPERSEPLAYRPSGLTSMPLMSAASSARRAQPFHQSDVSPQSNGSMEDWAASEYLQAFLLEDPTTPGNSPNFSTTQKSATLPLFLQGSDCQNEVPSSASSCFSPVFSDKGTSPYQFGGTAELTSRRSSLKRPPSSDQSGIAEAEEAPKPKPKRGRPRLPRNEPHSCDTSKAPCSHIIDESMTSRRVPHNQVEQKYRNGLNAELERLRQAVSTAPQRSFHHLSGPAKPSKAMVLASAIDYIKSIEAERDQLQDENQMLRGRNKRLRRGKKTATASDQ